MACSVRHGLLLSQKIRDPMPRFFFRESLVNRIRLLESVEAGCHTCRFIRNALCCFMPVFMTTPSLMISSKRYDNRRILQRHGYEILVHSRRQLYLTRCVLTHYERFQRRTVWHDLLPSSRLAPSSFIDICFGAVSKSRFEDS